MFLLRWIPGRADISVRPHEQRHRVANRWELPLGIRAGHMTVERAVGAFVRYDNQRQRRGNQAVGRGRDQVCQTRIPHHSVRGSEVILATGGRDIHRRGSWIGWTMLAHWPTRNVQISVKRVGHLTADVTGSTQARKDH